MTKSRCAIALIVAASVAIPGIAMANGRFPDAQQLVVSPDDPDHIAAQVTYGFIHTRNGGETWTWTCEEAASYGGVLDPPIALVSGGAMIAGVFTGLVVTSPNGCDVGLVPGELENRFILDVSTMKTDPTRAIALSSDGTGSNGFDTRVWRTTDSALTWSQYGTALPTDFLAFTIDAAPDDEARLYVSGFTVVSSNNYAGSLAVSDDAGATWTIKPIPGSDNDSGPYIAAVDPNDHDTIYVRLASLAGVLLVTHDAGDTWEEVFQGEGLLLGFALSPDGSEIRLGGDVDGLWKANTTDLTFEKMSDVGVRCLTWTPEALYACGREALAAYTIAKSFDGGETFEPIHHLQCLEGPDPACGDDTSISEVCKEPWGATKQILQTQLCEGGEGGGGAEGGAGAGGGGGGSGDGSDGCSCATSEPTESRSVWLLLALAMSGMVRRTVPRRTVR